MVNHIRVIKQVLIALHRNLLMDLLPRMVHFLTLYIIHKFYYLPHHIITITNVIKINHKEATTQADIMIHRVQVINIIQV